MDSIYFNLYQQRFYYYYCHSHVVVFCTSIACFFSPSLRGLRAEGVTSVLFVKAPLREAVIFDFGLYKLNSESYAKQC